MGDLLALVAASIAACAEPGRPLIAELLYDAAGDDAGHEFVELYNPYDASASLAGVRLEAGDGAGADRWTLRWTGSAAHTIAARGRFVIGGAAVPAADVRVGLDLQNGPDAVRLVWPDGAIEVVGYGALAFPEYACGGPAADAPSGQSLARIPDDSNQGGNALDFRPASPSPGAANQPARDALVPRGRLRLEPEQPEPGTRARLTGVIVNRGAQPWAAREAALAGVAFGEVQAEERFSAVVEPAVPPGDTAGFAVELEIGPAGTRALEVRAALTDDEAPGNDADTLRFRVGPGPLELTEIQFHPARGEGEWVEARNRGGMPLDPAGFRLGDRAGATGVPSDGQGEVPPDSFVVFAEDPAALLALHPALDPDRVWRVQPWASLNNTADSTGIADAVQLREADGTPCARVDYASAGVPAGVPIERRGESGWWPAAIDAGTPLAPPREAPALASRFEVEPRRLGAGGGPLRMAWSLPWPRARVAVELYDLSGRRLAILVDDALMPGRAQREWSAGGVRPGLYLIVLRARAESGESPLTVARALRIAGVAR
jgi:hypothetical protein